MFKYNTPTFFKKINIKHMSYVLTVLYILSVIPMLVIGFYNWPAVDDFSMSRDAHRYFADTGNVIGTVGAAFVAGIDHYMTWVGYFFSDIVSSLSPSVFGERLSCLVVFIVLGMLTFGVIYFFDALFCRMLGVDKYMTRSLSMITLLVTVQSMEKGFTRTEAFYWFSGAINYTFMFGMGLFWAGLLIRAVFDSDSAGRKRKLIWACIWGFCLGGANYMTALTLAVISALLILSVILVKRNIVEFEIKDVKQKESLERIWIPALFNLLGLAVSALAPGNKVRMSADNGMNPIKTIFTSIYYGYDLCLNDLMRWEVVVCFVMLIPICFKASEKIRVKLRHPFIFAITAFAFVCLGFAPPLFAVGNIGAGRIHAAIWAQFVVVMVIVIFYFTAWMRQIVISKFKDGAYKEEDGVMSYQLSFMVWLCVIFMGIGSALCVYVDNYYFCGTSAITDLLNNSASGYLAENEARLEILLDENITDAKLPARVNQPELITYYDVTTDSGDWFNTIVATYYGKKSVTLVYSE